MINHGRLNHGRLKSLLTVMISSLALSATAKETKHPFVPGEYVVKLKESVNKSNLRFLESTLGGQVTQLKGQSNAVLIKRPTVEKSEFAIENLNANSNVEYAEPNFIYTINQLPNDPELPRLWGILNEGQNDSSGTEGTVGVDVDAQRAWEITTGSSDVVVAIIDTGIGYNIEDLAPNVWTNEAEKNGVAGVDDDGNGYIDDIHGYDFVNKDGDPMDDHGHGSHCSGTIGAKGNDGKGIVGVAWDVKLMGIKFLSAQGGGTLADAIQAIDYATMMKVNIMSNSWGGGGYSKTLEESIQRAEQAGILFIAAAGNDGSNNDSNPAYPASYNIPNVVSVAAIDNRGDLASFSNYGRSSVHVAAPGVNVYSTTPFGYKSWSGTSMATPHVSGVSALLMSADPNMSYAEVKRRLIQTARPSNVLRGKVTSGLVSAYNALTDTVPPPDPEDPYNWDRESMELSSPHPYKDKYTESWTLTVPGAKKFALYFAKFDTERGYDKVSFKDASGKIVGTWSGLHDGSLSPVIEGDTVVITITSDESVSGYGFDITEVAVQK